MAERATRLGVRLGIPGVGMVAVGGATSKGRIGSLLRKAGSAMKQGSAALSSSIKQLGSQQQEAELQVAGCVAGARLPRRGGHAHAGCPMLACLSVLPLAACAPSKVVLCSSLLLPSWPAPHRPAAARIATL